MDGFDSHAVLDVYGTKDTDLNSPITQKKSYHLVALVDNKNPSAELVGGSFCGEIWYNKKG